jgi:hypothetical protein
MVDENKAVTLKFRSLSITSTCERFSLRLIPDPRPKKGDALTWTSNELG